MASSPRIEELQRKFDENPRRYFAPLANEYRKSGDVDQAIFICQEYLPQQPGHMSGHIVFGQALFEAHRYDEAKSVFETALTLDPENLIALRHLGDIARELGDPSTARSWYVRVLDADPRNDEIAAVLASLGETQPAASQEIAAPPVEGAPAAAAPEPVVELPLETEPTESPLADFAGIVDEVRSEAASGSTPTPAAELTVPHVSADSEPLDLDTLDLSFGGNGAATAPPAPAPPTEPRPAAPPPADFGFDLSPAPGAAPTEVAGPSAEVAASQAESARSAASPALEGLELGEHQPQADAFAPLEGLDVLEGSFMAPMGGEAPPARPSASPPGSALEASLAPAAPAAPEPTPPPPAGTSVSPSAAASPAGERLPDASGLPNLDEDLDSLFAEAAPASASGREQPKEPPARPAPPPIIGRSATSVDMPPLPPEAARTPAWGMPDLEVPGWEVKAPPPPPTPPIPAPAVPAWPSAEQRPSREVEAPRARESVEDATASAPVPFVTETMAELYVQQGHREAAIGIYRQLISDRPGDESLRVRLAELESLSEQMAAAPPAAEPESTTIRDFLSALAACRPRVADAPEAWDAASGQGGDVADERSAAPLEGLPVLEDTWSGEASPAAPAETHDAPAARPSREAPEAAFRRTSDSGTVGGSLDLLFSGADAGAGEAPDARPSATQQPSAAAPAASEEVEGAMPGEPARQAATELSLDVVFREPTPAASQEAAGFSFDQFFSQAANERGPAHATPEQAGSAQPGAGTDDIEQFNAWLEGLKKS